MWDLDNPNHETFKDLVFHPNHAWKEINLSHLQAHISIYPNDRTPVITYDMRGLWYRCFVFSPLFNVIIPKKNLNLFILLINSANLACNEQANAITSQMACWPFNDLVLKKNWHIGKGQISFAMFNQGGKTLISDTLRTDSMMYAKAIRLYRNKLFVFIQNVLFFYRILNLN